MNDWQRSGDGDVEETSIKDSVSNVLEEARMLLPGAQVLFGFQLIAVFNQPFRDRLSSAEQHVHLAATIISAIAIGLFMAPAAYHRQAEPESVSRRFLHLASRQLAWGTIPLAISLCLGVYIVASMITTSALADVIITAALLVVFGVLWYVMPRRAPSPRDRRAARQRGQAQRAAD